MILYPTFEKRRPLYTCSLVELIWREGDNNQHPWENLETRRKDHLPTHGEKQRRRYSRQDWCSALIDSHSWGPAGKKRSTWTYRTKISEYWILDLSRVGDSPNHWDISITSLANRRLKVLTRYCQDSGKFRLGLADPFLFQRYETILANICRLSVVGTAYHVYRHDSCCNGSLHVHAAFWALAI
jgi:hypothetical protein